MVEMNEKIEEHLKKLCKDYQVAYDLIDFKAEWDSSLNIEENLIQIKPKIEALKPVNFESDIDISKKSKEYSEIIELQEVQDRLMVEKEATTIFEKHLEELRKSPANLNKYFLKQYELITSFSVNPKINSLIIEGKAGFGKSLNTKKALSQLGSKVFVLTTYATALEFYHILYEHRDNWTIIIDDIPHLWKDLICLGQLLACLWEPRIVSYFSTTKKLKAPSQFQFNSKVIILTNEIPKNIEPILSRSYVFRQNFNYKEKLKMILEYCKMNNIPTEIFDFIKDNCNEAYSIDLRLPDKLYSIYLAYPTKWREISKTQLECDATLNAVCELVKSNLTVKEQVKKFMEETGMGRNTYFRYKRRLVS